jgi:hypothetical protein
MVSALKVVNHLGFIRRSRRGKAVKLDISLESFLLAKRYTTKDGKEWVNMMVPIEKLLDVLEGKTDVAGINQIENPDKGPCNMGEEDGVKT